MTGKDRAGNAIIDEAISESAVNKSFCGEIYTKSSGRLQRLQNWRNYGVLELKSYSSSFNNKKVSCPSKNYNEGCAGDADIYFYKRICCK